MIFKATKVVKLMLLLKCVVLFSNNVHRFPIRGNFWRERERVRKIERESEKESEREREKKHERKG